MSVQRWADLHGVVNGNVNKSPGSMGWQDGSDPSLNKQPWSMLQFCDDLERGLAKCLIEYRSKAEDVLAAHLEAIERVEHSHQLESAKLVAENRQLRELLSNLGATGIPQLYQAQPIMLSAEAAPLERQGHGSKSAARKYDTGKNNSKREEEEDEKQFFNSRSKIPKGLGGITASAVPGGSWQQFVAWVPNGAALSSPEPWKALPSNHDVGPETWKTTARSCSILSKVNLAPNPMPNPPKPSQGKSNTVLVGVVPGVPDHVVDEGDESFGLDDDSEGSDDRGKFELLDVWVLTAHERKKGPSRHGHGAFSEYESSAGRSSGRSSDRLAEEEHFNNESPSIFILNPDAGVRITWDLLSLTMVVYDMIMIPMVAFDVEDTPLLLFMEWCTRIFWTVDIGWSCFTGISQPNGSVEYRLPEIWKKYAKTWLGMDLFIVGSDWAGLLLSSGGLGLSRLARVTRVARVIRLLRMVRMQEVLAGITERVRSDRLVIMIQVAKLVVFLVSVSHMAACGWWYLGTLQGDTWVSMSETDYEAQDLGVQYLVSLQWAMSQFTGGMDDIVASSALERVYAVVMWVFGFMSAAVISSILTSALTQQYIIGGSGARKMSTLRKYLAQNKITGNLMKRICRSAKHAISGDLTPESVELLSVVSEPLKVEMHYQMYSPILLHHPFFSDAISEAPLVIQRVCHNALSTLQLSAGDVVFTAGEIPADPHMYFCSAGVLEYCKPDEEAVLITEKMWVSEAALWTSWRHQGQLVATGEVKVAAIDAQAFTDICRRWMKKSKGTFTPKTYAAKFVEQLNEQTSLTDLSFD